MEFENIIAMEPRNYVGDNFSRNTPIFKVAQYNIACCYSMLDQVGTCWVRKFRRMEPDGRLQFSCGEEPGERAKINEPGERAKIKLCSCLARAKKLLPVAFPFPSLLPGRANSQVEEALKSLDAAMLAGFDNYDQIRRDKNLNKVRASPKFQQLIEKYDEPVVNWNAVKATFGAFVGMFGGKKDE